MCNENQLINKAFETKLPYGSELTELLKQHYITEANVIQLLQKKAVYYGVKDKKFTVPIAASMLLTPKEFEFLKEKRNTKEDRLKHCSTTLKWTAKKSLFEAIPTNINIRDIVDTQFKGYEIVGNPRFVALNKNKATIEFYIDLIDNTKGWCNSRRRFNGKIELESINENSEIRIVKQSTSTETEEVCNKLSSYIKNDFQKKGYATKNEISIFFSSFINEERISFFWGLTGKIPESFMIFEGITDIDIKPDSQKKIPKKIPIEWMANKISKLHVSGNKLHDTFFIADPECHPYLIIWRMEAQYSFDDHIAKGSCRLNFEFSGYGRTSYPKSEFTISVSQLSLDKAHKYINSKKVTEHLLKKIDNQKMQLYKQLKGTED
jgi:hypothetical protein